MIKSIILISCLICCVSAAAYAQENQTDAGEKKDADRQTTLRVGKPEGMFINRGGASYVARAKVEVKNAGEVPAKDVRVTLRLPTGEGGVMEGAPTIQPRKSATYTYLAEREEPVPPKKELRAVATCSNCRN